MNTGVMFSSGSEEWETPQDLFDYLDGQFHFTLDAAATESNAKCERFFSREQNSLQQAWVGRVWCNPPYGLKIGPFVQRALASVRSGKAELVVMLLPVRTDTAWWQDFVMEAAEVWLVRGRLKFGGAQNSAPFPSCVVVFNRRCYESPTFYRLERDEGAWVKW